MNGNTFSKAVLHNSNSEDQRKLICSHYGHMFKKINYLT